MKEKIFNKVAWVIAQLVKPIYKHRERLKSKEFIVISVSVLLIFGLVFTFGSTIKNMPVAFSEADSVADIQVVGSDLEKSSAFEINNEEIKDIEEEVLKTEKNENIDIDFLNINKISFDRIPVYSLYINGVEKVFFRTKEEAEITLADLENKYTSQDENIEIIDMYFEEDIEIIKEYKSAIDLENIKYPKEALDYIIKGTDEERKHKIEKGENFWVLAEDYGISVNDLIKANPDVKPERLQIGQEISLIVPEPLINVCTVENMVYEEKIKYDVVYEDNSNLYKDEYGIKKRGVFGKKEIKAELVKIDGRELGKVILDEKIISEPVTKIVYKGTKNPPPKKGTGYFSKPLNRGTVTSGYGMRRHPVYYVSRMHTGVDIGAPYGTKIMASDGGTVIYAGWKDGLGYCVYVDHGANLVSIYGHMSSINVVKGQKVYKGKNLGGVGSTGDSTGNHLHFEIRKLGSHVNPNNYINLYKIY